jgi:hypothetical protein
MVTEQAAEALIGVLSGCDMQYDNTYAQAQKRQRVGFEQTADESPAQDGPRCAAYRY